MHQAVSSQKIFRPLGNILRCCESSKSRLALVTLRLGKELIFVVVCIMNKRVGSHKAAELSWAGCAPVNEMSKSCCKGCTKKMLAKDVHGNPRYSRAQQQEICEEELLQPGNRLSFDN